MPLTSSRTGRGRGPLAGAASPLVASRSARDGCGVAFTSGTLRTQLWQSSGVRGVTFLSAAYFLAAALTIGLMIASSAVYQSEVSFQALPSHVWMRAEREPS